MRQQSAKSGQNTPDEGALIGDYVRRWLQCVFAGLRCRQIFLSSSVETRTSHVKITLLGATIFSVVNPATSKPADPTY